MIDKSIPRYYVFLTKTDTKEYPKYELPSGYSIEFYKKGDELEWAKLECSLGQFENIEEGLEAFKNNFITGQNLNPEERIMFVKDGDGEYVATCALWNGDFLGKSCQRLHWLAVSDKCAGGGIAKALVSAALDLYNRLGYEGFIYLLTGTWYYRAIGIYRKFGFREYDGERSLLSNMTDAEFIEKNREALAIVNEKLSAYNSLKGEKNEKRN